MESSRIFVRGLPPNITEEDARKHFAKFPITDLKVFPNRRIAYVGFRTTNDANLAVKYFNKSFIRMSKINVEIARPFSDKSLPRPRTQRKEEQDASNNVDYVPPPKESQLKRKRDEVEDPKLKEFLEVYQKSKTWSNEEGHLDPSHVPATEAEEVVVPEGESDDEYQVIAKKPKTTREEQQASLEPQPVPQATAQGKEHATDNANNDEAMEDMKEASATGPINDDDWLRSRTNRVLDLVEDGEVTGQSDPESPITQDEEDESPETTQHRVEDSEPVVDGLGNADPSGLKEEDRIRETGRLYLRNLSYQVTEDDLREQFSKYGRLEEVHVPTKKSDGQGKGFAFIQFESPDDAVQAYLSNDATIFQGRLLHIISARQRRDTKLDDFEISKLPLKKQKEIIRRKDATKSTFNWNSLYLSQDAVMSTIAERMQISKADLMDPTSSDSAVKQAHAETNLLLELKNYFAQHGVDLEAFRVSSRGDTALLVKNIPYSTNSDEIKSMFQEHGTVKKFLMPPAGMTAIIEFDNAAQAKSAFAALSYRKFKDSILYLERAPKDLFKEGVVVSAPQTAPSQKPKLSATDLLEDESQTINTATLFVRNLNFSTTTERLAETFKPLEGFRSARVKTKIDPKRGVLSMGFGFLEFENERQASAAIRAMNGYSLDGHQLLIKASHKGDAEERRKEGKKSTSTKILIKNLPFEATKKDVRALFSTYGTLRSVRVPRKMNASSRGFAFCDFATRRDAMNAMEALSHTHLLGRRLNLEFAAAESDDPEKELEKMQQKIGNQANKVALQKLTAGGRKKFNVTGNEEDLDGA